jgi:nucleotide-binding universal stress UspA family protein
MTGHVAALLRKPAAPNASVPEEHRILVPVNGSRACVQALKHVIASYKGANRGIHLLNVQPSVMAGDVTPFTSAKTVEARRRAAGEALVERGRRLLEASGIDSEGEVVFGCPVERIVRWASSRDCTLIVMGTRGKGLIGSVFGRSVATRVVKRANVPVTLVTEHARPIGLPQSFGSALRERARDHAPSPS